MILESYAIIAFILLMAYILLRREKSSGYAIGILPLIIVPAAHITGKTIAKQLSHLVSLDFVTAWIVIELTALVMTCLLLGAISTNIKNRNLRISYLALCGGFSIILTSILLVRTVITF